MYESTHNLLINLYHKLSPDGFCVMDDYGLWACRRHVQDFMLDQGIHDEIIEIDPISAFLEIKYSVELSSRANLLNSTLF
jgi:O-methyltransferase